MTASLNRLSFQIVRSLFIVVCVGLLSLVFVGHNAINIADQNARAQQERFAAKRLTAVIEVLPEQQRSATVWDDAVEQTAARDTKWMDDNLGSWMQSYFGHDENYVLDQANVAFFAAVLGEIVPPDRYEARAEFIGPLVAQLRENMAEVSQGEDDPYEALAEVAVVASVLIGDRTAIVSVIPIISDSGDIAQKPGTEALHVALRYFDAELATQIGSPIELDSAEFNTDPPAGHQAGIPVTGPSGDVLCWLRWKAAHPGTDLLAKMLPVLIAVGLASGGVLLWIVRHLLRVSGQLQASEAQARRDIVALQQAREAAEVADRAKMNFMSVVSHELRTPLTVILGYARLGKNLRKMPPAQRLEEVSHLGQVDPALLQSSVEDVLRTATTGMEKIERSGEHLLFLVNELLDYAKMETGRLEVDPEICDVLEVLNPVVDQMRTLTDEKGLNLEATMAPCLMLADVTRTRQIVINLIGNAIKFTDAGKVSVVVNESEDKVHIEVSDTGTGIAPHELEKIFDAFHQADGSFSRSAAGTGLGLSVARELAHLEGGTISVRSEVGVGSTFTLSLPKSKLPDPS